MLFGISTSPRDSKTFFNCNINRKTEAKAEKTEKLKLIGDGIALLTLRFAWTWFNSDPGYVVAFLDKTFYDDYLCLVTLNEHQIQ